MNDLADGFWRVVLPSAIERKHVKAATDWRWQFVFPAARICRDPRFGPRLDITFTNPSCSARS